MKICITAQNNNLDAHIDPRFGRCAYFIIYDTETSEFEAIENPHIAATGGVGIQAGQLIADKGVKTVLTGNIGPNAYQTLEAAGIEVITGVSGIVKEAIAQYQTGAFELAKKATVITKSGVISQQAKPKTNVTETRPLGRGLGRRGRGFGRGRGLGRRRMAGDKPGAGLGGFCLCPQCGERLAHRAGIPCNTINCPKCGTKMTRE